MKLAIPSFLFDRHSSLTVLVFCAPPSSLKTPFWGAPRVFARISLQNWKNQKKKLTLVLPLRRLDFRGMPAMCLKNYWVISRVLLLWFLPRFRRKLDAGKKRDLLLWFLPRFRLQLGVPRLRLKLDAEKKRASSTGIWLTRPEAFGWHLWKSATVPAEGNTKCAVL